MKRCPCTACSGPITWSDYWRGLLVGLFWGSVAASPIIVAWALVTR